MVAILPFIQPVLEQPLRASEHAWNEFTKGMESHILNLFYGQIKSTVKCCECNVESSTYESFSNLSLELPQDTEECELKDCLDLYFNGEDITDWDCPECKVKRLAVKKLDISKLPPVLVIHLKRCVRGHLFISPFNIYQLSVHSMSIHFRFSVDPFANLYRKNQTKIEFPLADFDVADYLQLEGEMNHGTTYNLWAVSNHSGRMKRGHYTAICKNILKNGYVWCADFILGVGA